MTAYGEAAEQIVDMATKSTLKGVEVVTNLAGKGALSLATYLIAVLKEQKRTKGKARIEAFQGKPTKVFAIRREDFEQFAKEAKKYGVLYAAILNKKEQDGIVDVVVNAKDAARVNRISENFAITAKEIEELRKTILKSKAEKQVERADPTAEKAAHTVDDVTLSEMMGEPTPPQQNTHKQPIEVSEDIPNPTMARADQVRSSNPSEPSSESSVGIETDSLTKKRPSVKERIKEIKEERRTKEEQGKPQSKRTRNKGTTHQQPQKQKSTKAKEK